MELIHVSAFVRAPQNTPFFERPSITLGIPSP